MKTTEIIIKPHHLALYVACRSETTRAVTRLNGLRSGLNGYDEVSRQEMRSFLAEILTLPPDTPIKFTLGPDRICDVCPRNITGNRFNPKLDENVPEKWRYGPCNPSKDIPQSFEEDALTWFKQISETDVITLGIIPR